MSGRITQDNFVTCMRKGGSVVRVHEGSLHPLERVSGLIKQLGDAGKGHVGVGGVFFLNDGKIKAHVMPDFKPTQMVSGLVRVCERACSPMRSDRGPGSG